MKRMSRLLSLVALAGILIFLPACVAELATYPTPGYPYPVEEYPAGVIVYPADVYPYFWGGWYYYPYWVDSTWVYYRHRRPLMDWHGPRLRFRGEPPRGWHRDGHHRDGPRSPAPGFQKSSPSPKTGVPGPGMGKAGPPTHRGGMAPRSTHRGGQGQKPKKPQ